MRWLNPNLEPAFIGAVVAAVYGAVAMIYRAYHGEGVFDWDILAAAGALVWQLWTRVRVTPVVDPRSEDGVPLVPRTIQGRVER